MASLGSYIYNTLFYAILNIYNTLSYRIFRLFGIQPQPAAMDELPENTWTPCVPFNSDRYQPSVEDVLAVKVDLIESGIPLELIDSIIDFAEYWPHTSTTKSGPTISVRAGGDHENRFLVRSYPLGLVPDWEDHSGYQITDQYEGKFQTLSPQPWAENRVVPKSATEEVLRAWTATSSPRGAFPCRKIVFTIISHDQGWGGGGSRGGYAGSYTWFDVGKEELSAFREVALLEAWELAPWPQFRLYSGSQDPTNEAINQPPSASNPGALVCSLRTVSPTTVVKADPEEGDEENELQYRFSHALLPGDECLQKNIAAERRPQNYMITWTYKDETSPESDVGAALDNEGRGRGSKTGEYVRKLKLGDAVTVWGKSRFPGWINVVDEVKIDVYWAV